MGRFERIEVIREIEQSRNSRLLSYVCGDRRAPQPLTQIGDDAVRPIFDHLQDFGRVERLDLFLYSRGGDIDVPWRLVTMIREFCDHFAVLVPYRAHSAATLVALGADEIVLGRKGELGPIDPSLTRVTPQEGGSAVQEPISVEDVMGYVTFIRERGGLTDQSAIAGALQQLANQLGPALLGNVFRIHSHIRSVARKMLGVRRPPVDEQTASVVIQTLAERIYAHGHAISGSEAREIGLPVADRDDSLEEVMWRLMRDYEDELQLLNPIDMEIYVQGQDERAERLIAALIESATLLHEFGGDYVVKAQRAMPPQLNLQMQVNLQLPAGFDPATLPQEAAGILQQLVNQAQQVAAQQVQEAIRQQAPLIGYSGRFRDAQWRRSSD